MLEQAGQPLRWYHVQLFSDCIFSRGISDESWHTVYHEPPLMRMGEIRQLARSARHAVASAYHQLQGQPRAAKLSDLWSGMVRRPDWVEHWLAFEDSPLVISQALIPSSRYLHRFRLTCGFHLATPGDNQWWFVVQQIRNSRSSLSDIPTERLS